MLDAGRLLPSLWALDASMALLMVSVTLPERRAAGVLRELRTDLGTDMPPGVTYGVPLGIESGVCVTGEGDAAEEAIDSCMKKSEVRRWFLRSSFFSVWRACTHSGQREADNALLVLILISLRSCRVSKGNEARFVRCRRSFRRIGVACPQR